jgi:Flp pilus assembly protein TadD
MDDSGAADESQRPATLPPLEPVDPEEALASNFGGEDFLFHLYRGSELLQDNLVEQAKEELEQALSLQPRDVEGQGLLGVVYFRLGHYPRAIHIYEDIVRACPREVTPRVNLALCYLKTGQPSLAREMLEEVIRLVPDHRRAWGYLGLVFERLGDFEKALTAFEQAGQPHLARRMRQSLEQVTEETRDTGRPERDEVRLAAADAVQEFDGIHSDGGEPFARETDQPSDVSRSGRWRAVELAQELVPPPSRPVTSLKGRLGAAVPSIPPPPELFTHSRMPLAATPADDPTTLARKFLVLFPETPGIAGTDDGQVVATSETTFHVRLTRVRAFLPKQNDLGAHPIWRRARGRDLDEPLGGTAAPFVALEGAGCFVLAPEAGLELVAVQLTHEFLYICENFLVAFEAGVRHENGRLPNTDGEPTRLVQLSGQGGVVFETRPSLRALEVSAERPLLVRGRDVVGWTGRLLTQPLAVDEAPARSSGLLRFSGDGAVFLSSSYPEKQAPT